MSSLVTAELGTKDLINKYIVLPSRMNCRIDGHSYLNKRNQLGIWNKEKKRLYCSHNRRLDRCKECGGSGICEHGREKNRCKECGGVGICEHGKRKMRCKECGGSQICEHGKQKKHCKICDPMGHLISCVRSRTLSALKAQKASKNKRTMEYINCTVAHLYYHIELV